MSGKRLGKLSSVLFTAFILDLEEKISKEVAKSVDTQLFG